MNIQQRLSLDELHLTGALHSSFSPVFILHLFCIYQMLLFRPICFRLPIMLLSVITLSYHLVPSRGRSESVALGVCVYITRLKGTQSG